jgi:5-methylcytosine-specific restriction endonuclease McrA
VAWVTSDRLERLPADWERRRTEVFRVKGTKCLIKWGDGCQGEATDVDHIVHGDDHSLENLQPGCTWCHTRKSSAEGNAVRSMMRRRGKRQPERHPGMNR